MVRRKQIAVISLLVLLLPSCGSWDETKFDGLTTSTTPSPSSSDSTTPPAPSTAQASTVIDRVRIQATAAPADSDLELTVGAGVTAAADAEARVAATAAVRVELDGGAAQPSAPVRLEFDLSGRPDFVAELSDSVVPVVEAVSATDPNERDMFTGTWDPTTETLTAEVPHLTDFWVSAFNVFEAIENGVGRAFELIRGDSSSPCREKSELTIGDTEYVLAAGSPGAIAGCLVDAGGAVAIDFENATGSFYAIQVAPQDIGGTWVVGQPLSMDDAAGSMVVGLLPNNKGVLAGRSSGRFTLNPGVVEGEIRMVPQPHGVLVKSLLAGVNMFGIDLKRFEHIPEAWDCFVTGVEIANIDAQVTTAELNGMIDGIAQCLIEAERAGSGDKSKQAALHRLSVAVTLLIELPRQLLDFVAGGLQEAAGDSVKRFGLSASTTKPSAEERSPDEAGDRVIDRVEVSTWAYDRVEGDTYVADNTNAKQLTVYWKSFSGAEQVRGGCTSTVRIDGPGTSVSDHTSNCDSYNPGTYLKVRAPGVHTVTVTVRQEGQPEITAQRAVTILPHS